MNKLLKLTSEIATNEDITRLLSNLLLLIVKQPDDDEISFPDTVIELLIDMLGYDTLIKLKDKIIIDNDLINEIINDNDWIENYDDAFDFLLSHLKMIKELDQSKNI